MSAEDASTPEPPAAEEPPATEAAEPKAEDAPPAEGKETVPPEAAEKPKKRPPPPPEPLPWCSILVGAMAVGALVGVGVYWVMTTFVFPPGPGIEITQATWDEMTSGKTVFIKFYAPWCGHCQKMKPDWDTLTTEYKENPNILVADVDCTTDENKQLCHKVGVQSLPTLKHGDPDALSEYSGGRSLKEIREFAATLKPLCSPATIDLCDEEKKAKIAELRALGHDKREEMIKEGQAKMDELEAAFKKVQESLQAKYEEESKKKTEKGEQLKNSGLGMLKAVNAFEKKKKSEL